MDIVNDRGAVTDVNELAAGLLPTAEEDKALEEQLIATSLEDLIEDLSRLDYVTDAQDEDITDDDVNPALESLTRLVHCVKNSGGISRNDAHTLKMMTASMEGFEDIFENMPINSFTEMPSKVNFQPAMEGVLSSIGRRVIEFIRAIVKWIREKASAFVNMIKGIRTNVKKTDEAAKKTEEELAKSEKAMASASHDFAEALIAAGMMTDSLNNSRGKWDEARKKLDEHDLKEQAKRAEEISAGFDKILGKKAAPNWKSGTAERKASSSQLTITVPSIIYNMTNGETKLLDRALLGVFESLAATVSTHMSRGYSSDPIQRNVDASGLLSLAKIIDYKLDIDKSVPLDTLMKATRELASTFNAKANDVDVITTQTPEKEMQEIISKIRGSDLIRISDRVLAPTISLVTMCKKRSEALEAELTKDPAIVDKDPRVLHIEWNRKIIQCTSDINTIYTVIAKAYNSTVQEGARLSNNPGRAIKS